MPFSDPNNTNVFMIYFVMFKEIILGFIGGAIAYLFDYSKAKRNDKPFSFSIGSMFINMALGAFVAYMVGTVIPLETMGRDAIIGMSGVTAYQILLLAESNFAKWIFNKLTGEKSKEEKDKDV
jgi:hypothetical protein